MGLQPGTQLPAPLLFNRYAFPQHPVLSDHVQLQDHNGSDMIQTLGHTVWDSSKTSCKHQTSSFRQIVRVEVARKERVHLHPAVAESHQHHADWFSNKGDYVAILMLAWTYILSARWAEVMPTSCKISYVGDHDGSEPLTEQDHTTSFMVDIGDAGPAEARWWTAVLTRNEGWHALMTREQDTFYSPWCIFQPDMNFHISTSTTTSGALHVAASFSDACSYLDRFCSRFNIIDQSHVALAAVVLMPSMDRGDGFRIPRPQHSVHKTGSSFVSIADQEKHYWVDRHALLDRLICMSCNVGGIRPMLLSTFYNPNIECNAVTPWLQGISAAIASLTEGNRNSIGLLCAQISPGIAPFWLGSSVLGILDRLFDDIRCGRIPVDLTSAEWSGTVQSFLQQKISEPLVSDCRIQRADECRLLLLTQSPDHTRVPVCQWKPMGTTPALDVDIEVRAHTSCQGHQLRYLGFSWVGSDGTDLRFQEPVEADSRNQSCATTYRRHDSCQLPVSWTALDRDSEVISKNATRSIFTWLRRNGYARHERDLWKHEWIAESDSDEEDEDDAGSQSDPGSTDLLRVAGWVYADST